MIIRIQSPDGSKRVNCDPSEPTSSLFLKVQEIYKLEDLFEFSLFKDSTLTQQILMHERKTIEEYSLRHGDLIYLNRNKDVNNHVNDATKHYDNVFQNGNVKVELDDVDKRLSNYDGLIEKQMDPKICRHGANAKCVYCTPIEPYDEAYMKEHNIKHMSFHAYLRKLKHGIDKGKFVSLENISCKIKPGCKGHAPWPDGICTKCQPNSITLNAQPYRHVDNVTFENTSIVENFLNYWRSTGHQRVGFLYGYYDILKDVPLGIKAHVVAIYEPPQESNQDSIRLTLENLNLNDVDFVASSLGYKRVGWIFTDLVPDDTQKGTVKHYRNSKNYFLTSHEVIMAGFFQNNHPNPCNLSPDGYFGSKFVTVCVTGDKNNQVHMEAYQVSNQCMALVRDDCLVPTKLSPELAYVRESNRKQYIPDVFYKYKDKYGNNVISISRPLPIEYLLVDVPVSTPKEPTFTFNPLIHLKPFPIENRFIEGHLQDLTALSKYLNQFNKDDFLQAVSDFHLLTFLTNMSLLPLKDFMAPLFQAIKTKNHSAALDWKSSDKWATIEQLMVANNSNESSFASTSFHESSTSHGNPVADNASASTTWSCKYCTFENNGQNTSCEICNLPK